MKPPADVLAELVGALADLESDLTEIRWNHPYDSAEVHQKVFGIVETATAALVEYREALRANGVEEPAMGIKAIA